MTLLHNLIKEPNWIINFTEHGRSWETASHSAGQEISAPLWISKFRYYVYISLSLDCILSQMKPVLTVIQISSRSHFNITLSSVSSSSKWSVHFKFFGYIIVSIFVFPWYHTLLLSYVHHLYNGKIVVNHNSSSSNIFVFEIKLKSIPTGFPVLLLIYYVIINFNLVVAAASASYPVVLWLFSRGGVGRRRLRSWPHTSGQCWC
jgi:hypothetical protein